MTTIQQLEALDFFNKHAEDWRAKAEGVDSSKVNVIEQRNGYVLQVAAERSVTRSFLDVGCGTGELVCQIAQRGVEATGVDYAPEMIALASNKAQDERIARTRFVCCSIFDFTIQRESYDLISANGFIEYISQQDLLTLFDLVGKALTPGGSFVVGSRNRLFNLVSMNDFSLQDTESGNIDLLIREAVEWARAKDIVRVASAECAPLQVPGTEHAKTGIDVTTRYQYSPFQLISLLQDRGLRAVEVYPVHIHGVTPAFADEHLAIHTSIATLLQAYARHNTQLLSQASSFMLHLTKGK